MKQKEQNYWNEDNEQTNSKLWDNIKWPNISIIGVSEEVEVKREKNIFEEKVMVETFPNILKTINSDPLS